MYCSERKKKMDNKNKIVKTYNSYEVTITSAGKNGKAFDEALHLILEFLCPLFGGHFKIEFFLMSKSSQSAVKQEISIWYKI